MHRKGSLEDLLSILVIIIVVLFFVWIGVYLVFSAESEIKCLRYGYANNYTTFVTLEQYCIREENEYEITVPLDDIELENEGDK